MALKHFSASIVTPLNFVFFSFATIITTSVLYQGFHVDSAVAGITLMVGFIVIVIGVVLLFQYNLKQNKMTMSRRIEDINDEEQNIEISDNPFSLLNEAYPLHPKESKKQKHGKKTLKSNVIHPHEEHIYVRPKDSSENLAVNLKTADESVAKIPLVSLSEQIQRRDELGQQGILRTTAEISNPHQKIHAKVSPDSEAIPPENTNQYIDTRNFIVGDLESDHGDIEPSKPPAIINHKSMQSRQ
jgi:hypothetical protein